TTHKTSRAYTVQKGEIPRYSPPSPYATLFRSIALGETRTCTITNDDDAPHLIVIKHVVNDNGGTKTAADFSLTISGVTATGGNTFPGVESPGTNKTLTTVGAYTVTEGAVTGYTQTSASAGCAGTIAPGETRTCTIVNHDVQPKLIVIQHVINDNGGTATAAGFTMSVTGSSPSPASFPGAESSGTTVALDAGSYSVSASSVAGYTQTSASADCSGTIALAETTTCTIVNDDVQPKLIVIEHVINDNGGTALAGAFTMSVTGSSPGPVSFAGLESPGQTVSINADAYSVAENGPSGYAGSSSADCAGAIAVGETRTCTVTNDDIQPGVTLLRTVVSHFRGT